jgi:predicted oxidoreductase
MTVPEIQLHSTLRPLSRLIYGAWRLADDTDTSDRHIQAKIEACLAQGIHTFDHADIYGDYQCESLFGRAFAGMTEYRSICRHITKCDIALKSSQFPTRRVKHYDTSARYITDSVETSLSRLGLEQLDVVLIHRPDPLMDPAETGAALDALIDSGKTVAVGVSNFRPWDWALLQQSMRHPLITNQIEISLLHHTPLTNGDLASLQTQGVHPMAWSPLAGGQLFQAEHPVGRRLMPQLKALAETCQVEPSAVALAWLLAHPAGIVPIVGTNALSRIQTLSQCFEVTLDRETWFELYELALGHEVP